MSYYLPNETEQEIEIDNLYKDVNFSILPSCMLNMYKRKNNEDIQILLNLRETMKYYPNFLEANNSRRNTTIENNDDLLKYFISNNLLSVSSNDLEINSLILLEEYKKELEKIFTSFQIFCQIEKEDFTNNLKLIEDFIHTNREKLDYKYRFITTEHSFGFITCIQLFSKLSISDRIGIVKNKYNEVDLSTKKVSYLIFIKLFFNISIDRQYSNRHPYLVALRGSMIEIIEYINSFFNTNNLLNKEEEIKSLCRVFASVAEINERELIIKCLNYTTCLSNLTKSIAFRKD
jgi:hypothetical protein